jgi:hypothetical protein
MAGAPWHTSGGSTFYWEKVYPNKKVGHVTAHVASLWQARLDGIYLGSASNKDDAILLVDFEYKERYGA